MGRDLKAMLLGALGPLGTDVFLRLLRLRERRVRVALGGRGVTVEATRACPLRCSMCLVKSELGKGGGDREAAEIVARVLRADPRRVTLTGGEPLIRKDIFRVVRPLAEKGVRVNILTSGNVFKGFNPEAFCGLENVSVCLSIDGPAPVHDAIRGVAGALQRGLEFAASVRAYVKVGAQTVVQPANIGALNEIVDVCHAAGIDRLTANFERFNTDREIAETTNFLAASGFADPERLVTASVHDVYEEMASGFRRAVLDAVGYGLRRGVLVSPAPMLWLDRTADYLGGRLRAGRCLALERDDVFLDADLRRVVCTNLRVALDEGAACAPDTPHGRLLTVMRHGKMLAVCARCCNFIPEH